MRRSVVFGVAGAALGLAVVLTLLGVGDDPTALTDGQAMEAGLGYAPLPAPVQQQALASLHTITSGGAPIWP